MAVYTKLTRLNIETLLQQYQIGHLDSYQEISAGIENTNYFVDTHILNGDALDTGIIGQKDKKECCWVLTIFENVSKDELPYFCELTNHLARDGFKVPAPLKTRDGHFVFSFKDKAGLIVPRLQGESLSSPDSKACAEIGKYLASMHLSLREFAQSRPLVRDINWMQQQRLILEKRMPDDEFQLLSEFLSRYEKYNGDLQCCPQGTVHGDLFHDNVVFERGEISGIFDFYHACNTTLLFDLAVIANDWAVKNGCHQPEMLHSLITAYQSRRPWTEMERAMWPACLELAALRFWLSRLVSFHLPSYQQQSLSGETLKDPDEMKAILLSLRDAEL